MAAFTVLVTDAAWPATDVETQLLAPVGARLVRAPDPQDATLRSWAVDADADALLVGSAHVGRALMDAAPRLRVIARYGIGIDNVDLEEATRRGIAVTTAPGFCREEVAEHVLALTLSLLRGVHLYDRAVRAGDWTRAGARSVRRLAGQVLGIVGFGSTGQAVAVRALGLGLHPIAHDPILSDDAIRTGGAEPVGVTELAARADVITLHAPLSDSTRGLVDAGFLRVMKPTAYLINTARGALVDHDALVAALAEGRIAGAGLDTFAPEPLAPGDPLLASERALLTPHVAFYSEASVYEVRRRAAGSVAVALGGGRPADTVNPAAFQHPRWHR